ncbi:putative multi-domain containing protein [Aduncisulcus paluster]|uniref:Multi-domain containing protein n=1 Tax=Aduncisulcus paluster TaxID=2918883 RepID=A0ABQ5K5Y6_9EUKA|nr:putative multi-domain containing protein [Aduncisulcus paluster]
MSDWRDKAKNPTFIKAQGLQNLVNFKFVVKENNSFIYKFVWKKPALFMAQMLSEYEVDISPNAITFAHIISSFLLFCLHLVDFGKDHSAFNIFIWSTTLILIPSIAFLDALDGSLAIVTLSQTSLGHLLDCGVGNAIYRAMISLVLCRMLCCDITYVFLTTIISSFVSFSVCFQEYCTKTKRRSILHGIGPIVMFLLCLFTFFRVCVDGFVNVDFAEQIPLCGWIFSLFMPNVQSQTILLIGTIIYALCRIPIALYYSWFGLEKEAKRRREELSDEACSKARGDLSVNIPTVQGDDGAVLLTKEGEVSHGEQEVADMMEMEEQRRIREEGKKRGHVTAVVFDQAARESVFGVEALDKAQSKEVDVQVQISGLQGEEDDILHDREEDTEGEAIRKARELDSQTPEGFVMSYIITVTKSFIPLLYSLIVASLMFVDFFGHGIPQNHPTVFILFYLPLFVQFSIRCVIARITRYRSLFTEMSPLITWINIVIPIIGMFVDSPPLFWVGFISFLQTAVFINFTIMVVRQVANHLCISVFAVPSRIRDNSM